MGILKTSIGYINKHIAGIAIWVIIAVVAGANYNLKFWKSTDKVIVWDIKSYYGYLPAAFIYQDFTFSFNNNYRQKYGEAIYPKKGPKGFFIIQVTYGLALLYSPFFLAAHGIQVLTGGETSGYSEPYRIALLVSSVFYLMLGLYYLKKFLLKYFSTWTTAITLVVIVLGTNLLHYASNEAPMSHTYNFALIALFMYFTTKWYEKTTAWNSILIGFLASLITLIRPTNLLVALFFVLWDVNSLEKLKERINFLLKSYKWILLMIPVAFLVWVPQFLYWKFISGSYIFYSYDEMGFFFNNPQIINSLFSYRKGLFLYIPLTAVAFTGISFLFKKHKGLILPVALILLINVYVLSSWCFWWFGGSFGPRSYIDTYAILAVPFAAITGWFVSRKIPWIVLYLGIVSTLIWFNFFQTSQYLHGAINWTAMTKEAYWDSFLRKNPSEKFASLLRFPNRDNAIKGIYYKDDLTWEQVMPAKAAKKDTKEDLLNDREKYIKKFFRDVYNYENWLKVFKEKAAKNGVPVDTQIRKDAIWFYNQDLKKKADSLSVKEKK
jgi:hypothetical protein